MEKTVKDHLIAALKCLKKEELDHFKDKLAEKKFNGNSIGAGQLEDASVINVADRIVRLFTKKSAANITVEVLNDIGQNQLAEELQGKTGAALGASAGGAGGAGASGKHVMISYSHKQKTMAKKIEAELKSVGIEVWRDEPNTAMDFKEEIAEAIENAWAVLVCLSTDYDKSDICNKELDHAVKKKKLFFLKLENFEPKSKIQFQMGDMLYHKFTDEISFQENIEKLKKDIIKISEMEKKI